MPANFREEFFAIPCADPRFLTHVATQAMQAQPNHFLHQLFDVQRELHLTPLFDLSGVQDSYRFRALHRARNLATFLMDSQGEVIPDAVEKVILALEKEGNLFYPQGFSDSTILEHQLTILRQLRSAEVLKSLKRFQTPLCHGTAERLVFETLREPVQGITVAHLRRAVLCASLTPLRQNVGSCFATAPAILIQREQYLQFLDDLYQLLSTGKLKRTFGGVEYAVPLSPNTGIGDLKKSLVSPDSRLKPWMCPGILAAFDVLFPSQAGLGEEAKAGVIENQIAKVGKRSFSVDEWIHAELLEQTGVAEEDLQRAHKMARAHIKQDHFSVRGSPTLKKLDAVQRFIELEAAARSAFNGMCDNALLKAWEFTLASYSEVKMEFSRWNLYSSLGLSHQEPGGIGGVIYHYIEESLVEINAQIEEYQKEYAIAFDQVRGTETLLRKAGSDAEVRRLQAEYQSRVYHMRSCQEIRDTAHAKGTHLTELYTFLIHQYDKKFPEYFQEIYDAQMQDFQGDLYNDSPAGFRLVYKHGRLDPALWTLIYDADQYIESLVEFFIATESQVAAECEWEGGESAVCDVTSAIVAHVRTDPFLETALQRMAKAHEVPVAASPLTRLSALEKKPWAYTSGGTMTTLVKTYYCLPNELRHEGRWAESEIDLLIFLIDAIKHLPPKSTDPFVKNPQKGLLISSPTHAFILLPGAEKFKEGWQEEVFTYTWVRDEVFLPSQKFYGEMRLNAAHQEFLLEAFAEELPPLLSHFLQKGFTPSQKELSVIDWRNRTLSQIAKAEKLSSPQMGALSDALDSFLYQNVPIVSGKQWKALVRRLISDLATPALEEVMQRLPDVPCSLLTARAVKDMAKSCYLIASGTAFLPFDLSHHIAKHARFIGLAAPTPVLFADTNWTENDFGFVVNPGTGRLELWRLDRTLSRGYPMSLWKQWVNGTDRKQWIVYTETH